MLMTEAPQTPTSQEVFQRETWRYVVLPFTLFMLVVLIVILLAFVLPQDGLNGLRAAAVGNFLLVLLVLCPSMLLMIPLYLLIVVLNFAMRQLHDGTERPLARLEARARTWREQVTATTDKLNRSGAQWSIRLAPLLSLFNLFDASAQEKIDNDGQSTDPSKP